MFFKQVKPFPSATSSSMNIKHLLDIMEKLRAPDGCPWDQKQTHESLIPYLEEESWEVIDEIKAGNLQDPLKDELGDLLLQVVFHAQIAKEEGRFSFADIVKGISEKMIRRHPHVFDPDWEEKPESELKAQWDDIKQSEKKGTTKKTENAFEKIPASAPPLFRARKISEEAIRKGFDWPGYKEVLDKVDEEVLELKQACEEQDQAHIQEEIGDLLFTIVNLSRHLNVDPNDALTTTNNKFIKRFKPVNEAIEKAEKQGETLSLQDMEKVWQEAKGELG